MSVEDNRTTVSAFLAHLAAQDADGLLAIMADEATWWVPSDQIGGQRHSKSQMAEILPAMFSVYAQAPKLEIGRMIASGDCVCAELTARGGKTRSGLTYENDYLLLFALRDGEVREIREFLNPIFVGPLAADVMRYADNATTS